MIKEGIQVRVEKCSSITSKLDAALRPNNESPQKMNNKFQLLCGALKCLRVVKSN